MFGGCLDARLSRVGEQASCYTQEHLSSDDTVVGGACTAAAEVDEESEGYHE